MRYIDDFEESLNVMSALGSEVRISILNLLLKNGRMSMKDLADTLGLSAGALTPHMKKLESAGLIRYNSDADGHGNQKICEPSLSKILLNFGKKTSDSNEYHSHLRVGQYSRCKIYPTCGLSTSESFIGDVDDARYFTDAKHFNADILWFTKGYVEYMVPCILPPDCRIDAFSMSAELSSEAPGSNPNWPSDICFSINGTDVGIWVSPGDYADVPGLFTPSWWFSNWNQYGLLKTLIVNHEGTFIDDTKISDVTIDKLNLDASKPIYFRFSVPSDARHIGGLTIFGRDFGNYNQDIEFKFTYSTPDEAAL